MTKCTQAQIEAAIEAYDGNRPVRRDELGEQSHHRAIAAALTAAAEVGDDADAQFAKYGPTGMEDIAAEAGEQQITEAFNDGYEDMRAQIPRIKNETIERCAQFAHDWLVLRGKDGSAEELSAAIRAMRERP